jgi:hypothetical protein
MHVTQGLQQGYMENSNYQNFFAQNRALLWFIIYSCLLICLSLNGTNQTYY